MFFPMRFFLDEMMEYHVYITTNNINGKKYLGKHNGKNPNYLGSGTILKDAIKKYGKYNFSKEIVYICQTDEEAYVKERELSIAFNIVEDDMWYNLRYGGEGFLSGINHPMFGVPKTEEQRALLSMANIGHEMSDDTKMKISKANSGEGNSQYGKFGKDHPASGHKKTPCGLNRISEAQKKRIRSDEEKLKLSENRKGKGLGENNSMSNPHYRKKVGDSKIGRKRYYREDGSFYMTYPDNPIDPRN